MTDEEIIRQVRTAEGFLELGNTEEAWRMLNDFPPKIRLTNYPVLFAQLKVLTVQRDWPRAETLAGSLSRCLPRFTTGWYGLAVAQTQLGKLAEARAALKRAFELEESLKLEALQDENLAALW